MKSERGRKARRGFEDAVKKSSNGGIAAAVLACLAFGLILAVVSGAVSVTPKREFEVGPMPPKDRTLDYVREAQKKIDDSQIRDMERGRQEAIEKHWRDQEAGAVRERVRDEDRRRQLKADMDAIERERARARRGY